MEAVTDSLEHSIAMHMQGLTGDLTALRRIAEHDHEGLVLRELDDLELTCGELERLIGALRLRKVTP